MHKLLVVTTLCVLLCQACGSTQTNQNAAPPPANTEAKGGYPFTTREPEAYQGDFVVDGRNEDRTFVARKGDKWRRDYIREGKPWLTELRTDKVYAIDHVRKVYTEQPVTPTTNDSINELTFDFFKGKNYNSFDEVSREGSVVRYKVRQTAEMKDEIMVDFDQTSGMIVRHEFKGRTVEGQPPANYLFEIKNLSLNVPDSVFEIPAGYKKISASEYQPPSFDPKNPKPGKEKESERD
jgi:hypothetical protein